MAPMPAIGDDLPQSDNGLGTSPSVLAVSSSDDDNEEEFANAGYQPLPQGEPDDDGADEGDTEVESADVAVSASAEVAASASAEAFCRKATSNIVLNSSHLPPVNNRCHALCDSYSYLSF